MCLYVDFDAEIYDDQVYTFYKVYIKQTKTKYCPLGLYSPYQRVHVMSYNLVAKAGNKALPESGQEAYDEYAREHWSIANEKYPHYAHIHYGIHAYTSLEMAKRNSFTRSKIVKVEVLGKHIMAFSRPVVGEVVFTRGTIVPEFK